MNKRDKPQEHIVIVGYGWVGQANALALRRLGYPVSYYDILAVKPRYEDEEYSSIERLGDLRSRDGEDTHYVVCVSDRLDNDKCQDITSLQKALELLQGVQGTVTLRSTVLPQHLNGLSFDYYVPEFLHEKYAVEECLNPEYFVIGGESLEAMPQFLLGLEARAKKVFRGTPGEAAHIKYLSNIWNALRISFVNEFGNAVHATEKDESSAERVLDFLFEGGEYLRYGRAYSGHCLPKDVLAFARAEETEGRDAPLLRAIHESNEVHKREQEKKQCPEWYSSWGRSV